MAKLCPLASGYRRWGLRGIALFKEEAMREELDFIFSLHYTDWATFPLQRKPLISASLPAVCC